MAVKVSMEMKEKCSDWLGVVALVESTANEKCENWKSIANCWKYIWNDKIITYTRPYKHDKMHIIISIVQIYTYEQVAQLFRYYYHQLILMLSECWIENGCD